MSRKEYITIQQFLSICFCADADGNSDENESFGMRFSVSQYTHDFAV